MPLPDACVNIALLNGLFNLDPAGEHVFRKLAPVVRPEGIVYAAELILAESLPAERQTETD